MRNILKRKCIFIENKNDSNYMVNINTKAPVLVINQSQE